MIRTLRHLRGPMARAFRSLLPIAVVAAVGACEGENLYKLTYGGGVPDTTRPEVFFLDPGVEEVFAAGDSVLTRVQVEDDRALQSLELSGHAFEADGGARVERFQTRTFTFGTRPEVTDTLIVHFMRPTAHANPVGTAYLVATAKDRAGNVRADTVPIEIRSSL